VADQVVGHLAEVLTDGDGVAEPLQRVAVGWRVFTRVMRSSRRTAEVMRQL
jgi:hypothetical protein